MIDAVVYLTRTTIQNRLASQARRLRQPRYALALILGAAYFWLVLLRPGAQPGRAPVTIWNNAELVAALGILLLMLGGWVFSGERMALAFTAAEVQFLFPAPVTRRGLIIYKLFRSQLIILFNALIWVFVLRRSGSVLAAPLRFVGTWMLFSNLSLHRLGAALVRTSLVEHGRAGIRRQLPAILLGAASIIAVVLIFRDAIPLIRGARGGSEIANAIETAANLPAARTLLFLPRIMVAPSFAQSSAQWLQAAGASLIMLLIQFVWVIQSDVAFEEAAVQASVERARRLEARRRRSGRAGSAPTKAKRTLPLAPIGIPAGAIVWKNTLLLMRTGRIASVIGLAIMAVVIPLPTIESRGIDGRFVALASLVMVLLLIVLGSRVLQNDFRQDADHVTTLKTLPITGAQLVGAEVVSSALPMALLQLLLVIVAFVATVGDDSLPLPLGIRTAILLVSPVMLVAVNATTVTIQNAAALLFPGWTRVTPIAGGGVEGMGQGILVTGILLLTFVVALLPAAAAFAIVLWLLPLRLPNGWIIALFAAAATLMGETWWAVRGLGRRFERMEPSA